MVSSPPMMIGTCSIELLPLLPAPSSLSNLRFPHIFCSRSNAMMYNTEGSQVFTMAQEMLRESEHQIAHYRSLQHDMGR